MGPSKEDLVSAANDRLERSPYRAVRQLRCEMEEGVLVLKGRVSSYYAKQQAQETVLEIEEVGHMVNAVTVSGSTTTKLPPNSRS